MTCSLTPNPSPGGRGELREPLRGWLRTAGNANNAWNVNFNNGNVNNNNRNNNNAVRLVRASQWSDAR